jgi:hypothetical protein
MGEGGLNLSWAMLLIDNTKSCETTKFSSKVPQGKPREDAHRWSRKAQHVNLWKDKLKLVLGEDIYLDQILFNQEFSLVGKFHGNIISEIFLGFWRSWRPLLSYSPNFHILVKVWLNFVFNLGKDLEKIH